MKKGCLVVILVFITLVVINLFFRKGFDIKRINRVYYFQYGNEIQDCYVQKKGEEKIGGVFGGKILCFGLKEKKIFCRVVGFRLIKNGWYALNFENDKIEFLQDEQMDIISFAKLYDVKIVNIHDYFGYKLDPHNAE